ncbi:hypothetical protein SAMN05661080_04828, partial [Modestobacter sp. DSM 44400]|uniref:hypothetical protein n=1 Tax=Modestobacter sp. DSM 44400 TaxID=1550230 RepID=UPI0008987CE8
LRGVLARTAHQDPFLGHIAQVQGVHRSGSTPVRWTSDYLTAEYSQLTPDRVPSAALQSLEVVSAGEAVVDVVAVYNTGLRVIIRAEDSAAGWKVTRVEQAD